VYEDYLFSLLERVQRKHPEHIPASVEVREAFGIPRSFRRGATSIAQNAPRLECDEGDIDRNNRWCFGESGHDEASVDEDATIVHGYSADAPCRP